MDGLNYTEQYKSKRWIGLIYRNRCIRLEWKGLRVTLSNRINRTSTDWMKDHQDSGIEWLEVRIGSNSRFKININPIHPHYSINSKSIRIESIILFNWVTKVRRQKKK